MVQIYSLYRHCGPVEAVKTGLDATICFDCPHRGIDGKKRSCYVNIGQGPNSVWKAYRNGRYPHLDVEYYQDAFSGRPVRFGSYGEPIHLPVHLMRLIASACDGWTGYSHQWRRPEFSQYREFLMASVDTPELQSVAVASGWRTFRVKAGAGGRLANEISCPASEEMGARTKCETCRLCNGAREHDRRRSVAITVHGAGKSNFIQISAAA